MPIEIILDSIILILLLLSLLICVLILILILICFRPLISNVPILLISNTYITLSLTSIMMFIIYVYNLYVDIYPLVSVEDNWCQLRAYFVNVCFCALYYSCVLQTIFRLVRIVFPKFKSLQSTEFFVSAIGIQWLLSFTLILFNYLRGDYQYLSFQYRCWISFYNTRGLLIAALIIYACPLVTMLIIYIYILRYVRRTAKILQRRQKANERDFIILKRIVIFVLVIFGIGLPTVSILFLCMISNYLIPMAYHVQGLSMAMGVFTAAICFAFITPQLRELFNRKQRRVYSYMMIRVN